MNYEAYELPESHQQVLDDTPEPHKIEVSLLDRDNLPIGRGTAVLPLLLGVGIFWPDSQHPPDGQMTSVKSLALTTGERLRVKTLTLCKGNPLHYKFWINAPLSSGASY
jgi:hypothetical protein